MTTKIFSMITAEELSMILNVKVSTIRKLAKKNQIPCSVVNSQPVFSIHKIVEHFSQLERGAIWTS